MTDIFPALWNDSFNLDFEDDLLKDLNTLPSLYDNSYLTLDLMEDPLLMDTSVLDTPSTPSVIDVSSSFKLYNKS